MNEQTFKKVQRELRKKALRFAQRIQPIFELMKWEWHPEEAFPPAIPTVEDINDALHDLISSLDNLIAVQENGKPGSVEMGGLKIEIVEGDHSSEAIMSFNVEEYINI